MLHHSTDPAGGPLQATGHSTAGARGAGSRDGSGAVVRALRGGPPAAEVLRAGASGVVVSVHRQAVNVLLDGGPVVALLGEPRPVHPWAICLPLLPPGLREGTPARCSGTELTAGPVTILLEEMEVADLRLHVRPPAFPEDLLHRLRHWVNGARDDGPFADALLAALDAFRAGGDPCRLATVLGVGEGLTPSGDDVLVGVLAGLDLARDARPWAPLVRRELAAALTDALADPRERRTTRLSEQMLRAAIEGLYAEPVLAFLKAIPGAATEIGSEPATRPDTQLTAGRKADPEQAAQTLEQAATTLLAMGHRSGGDTLRGIVAALARANGGGTPNS